MNACRHALAVALLLALPHAAPAAEPAPPAATPPPPMDAEEALDESLKRFGYLTGLARGCVVDAQRPKLEREALDLAAGIARLFGTDRAFLYSSSFGYGTAMYTETKDCAEVLKQYDQRVERFRAGRGAAQ